MLDWTRQAGNEEVLESGKVGQLEIRMALDSVVEGVS